VPASAHGPHPCQSGNPEFLLAQIRSVEAQGTAPVLRGRVLEIVDDQGRLRANIKLQPADENAKMANGKAYPETVIFRLINRNGQPIVKLGTSEQGSGLALMGESGSTQTYVVLKAEGTESSIKLTNKDGPQKTIKP